VTRGPIKAAKTKFARFMKKHDIVPFRLWRLGRPCSWRHFGALRNGENEPTRPTMIAIAKACSRYLGRTVRVAELFDLGRYQ
jgi:hypothetical protein